MRGSWVQEKPRWWGKTPSLKQAERHPKVSRDHSFAINFNFLLYMLDEMLVKIWNKNLWRMKNELLTEYLLWKLSLKPKRGHCPRKCVLWNKPLSYWERLDESLDPSLWNISTQSQCDVPLGGKTHRAAELGLPLLPDFSIKNMFLKVYI